MSRDLFNLEKGIGIFTENSDAGVYILTGTGTPGGDSGIQDAAPIGTLFLRQSLGIAYIKESTSNNTFADWKSLTDVQLDELRWRNEKIIVATSDAISDPGDIDPDAWADNDGFDANDLATNGFLFIGDLNGTPTIYEITDDSDPNALVAVAIPQVIAENDTFIVQNYLPDPAGQEDQAIIHFPTTTSFVKIGDVNWNFADGINMAAGYAAVNGTVSSDDSVNSAIEKLDGNQLGILTANGLSAGDTDMGVYTGNIITDNSVQTVVNQELESAIEAANFNASVAVPAATATDIGAVLVDDFNYIEYEVFIYESGDQDKREGFKFTLMHDGTTSADATDADFTVHTKLSFSGNKVAGLSVDFSLSGTGVAQTIAMELTTTNACVAKVRRTAVVL